MTSPKQYKPSRWNQFGFSGWVFFCALAQAGQSSGLNPQELLRLEQLEQSAQFSVLTVNETIEKKQLAQTSRTLKVPALSVERLARHLEKTLVKQEGMGISAVQLGIPVALVLLKQREGSQISIHPFVNPVIVRRSPKQLPSWEKCLSVPWGYRFTLRASELKVRYLDLDGRPQLVRLYGEEAVVFQQEVDHLRGHLLSSGYYGPNWFIPNLQMNTFTEPLNQRCRSISLRECAKLMRRTWKEKARAVNFQTE